MDLIQTGHTLSSIGQTLLHASHDNIQGELDRRWAHLLSGLLPHAFAHDCIVHQLPSDAKTRCYVTNRVQEACMRVRPYRQLMIQGVAHALLSVGAGTSYIFTYFGDKGGEWNSAPR